MIGPLCDDERHRTLHDAWTAERQRADTAQASLSAVLEQYMDERLKAERLEAALREIANLGRDILPQAWTIADEALNPTGKTGSAQVQHGNITCDDDCDCRPMRTNERSEK